MSEARILQAAFLLLLLLQVTWHALLPSPHGNGSWILAVVATVPLLFPIPGILEGRVRSMTWGAYVLVLYFVLGIMESWSNPAQRIMALSQVSLTLLYFAALLLLVRRLKQNNAGESNRSA